MVSVCIQFGDRSSMEEDQIAGNSESPSLPPLGMFSVSTAQFPPPIALPITGDASEGSSKTVGLVPVPARRMLPPATKMAGLNLNNTVDEDGDEETQSSLSLKLSASAEEKVSPPPPQHFRAMSNGDSIISVA